MSATGAAHERTQAIQQKERYSITSSAEASSVAGNSRPGAIAANRPYAGSMPFALSTGAAAGAFKKSMNALAAAVSFDVAPMPAVNTTYLCNSAGSGPASSIPVTGKISLIRMNPSSALPLATFWAVAELLVSKIVLSSPRQYQVGP